MKDKTIPVSLTKKQLIISKAIEVIEAYTTRLTVRQIYYRLVSVHVIENKMSEYQAVVNALGYARLNDLISWDSIEDRTRAFIGSDFDDNTPEDHFGAAKGYFENCHKYFTLPFWKDQPEYVEIWLEKQALAAVFEQITDKWKVRLAPCRGYPSLTFLHEGSEHLNEVSNRDITILYFGDFDPSGLDITRNVKEQLQDTFGVNLSFERIAITQEQIAQYKIPPMPAKTTDSRAAEFIAEHGSQSAVELDALDPNVLQDLISQGISEHFDQDIKDQRDIEVAKGQAEIKKMIAEALKK